MLYATTATFGSPARVIGVGDMVLFGYGGEGNFSPAVVDSVSSTGIRALTIFSAGLETVVPLDGGETDLDHDATAESNGVGSLSQGKWMTRPT